MVSLNHRFFVLWILFGHGVDAFLSLHRGSAHPSSFTSLYASFSSVHVVLQDPLILLTPQTVTTMDALIQQRNQARKIQDFPLADALLQHIMSHNITDWPPDCSIRVTDLQEGSEWSVLYHIPTPNTTTTTTSHSVLQLAHLTLGSRVAASEQQRWDSVTLNDARDQLVQQAKERLQAWSRVQTQLLSTTHRDGPCIDMSRDQWQTLLETTDLSIWAAVESDLQGRKSADAAFWFALAGVTDETLFALLTNVVCKELTRFGTRPSCRLKDVQSMAKRMAAAGVRHHAPLEQVLKTCLEAKNVTNSDDAVVSFHSDGCALMLWEFSTRQRKQKSFLDQAARHWRNADYLTMEESLSVASASPNQLDWYQVFEDPHRPLVVDVGCGMGVSLLGLASLSGEEAAPWEQCNFLGIDLNPVTIGYGSGIAQRWNVSDRLAFVVDTAERALQNVLASYPGCVHRILIQFPTPYRLSSTAGNAQLPSSAADGFMVSIDLLRLCRDILVCHRNDDNHFGELWLQSNCEDVAVWMRNTACHEAGFSYSTEVAVQSTTTTSVQETQRTLQWIAMGGERAQGPGWYGTNLLPRTAMTETEVACIVKGTPVHRCILSPRVKN